ncbi:MAG: phosphoglucosamine mutase [Candidatus Thorarchaeota archaeon]|nr:MAG: phosphoglucosamine mutase [Candidatus Thorarchaeota archaeon]
MGQLFGTNGVRGVINEGLTPELVMNLGRAIGTILGPGRIAVARDARKGGEMFSRAVIAGLLSTGCSVVDIGLAPTPCLQFMVPRLNCVAGVMITGSHNPPEFNGIKVMGSNGIEVKRETEAEIEKAYSSGQFRVVGWDEIGEVHRDDTAIRTYIDAIKSHVDVDIIRQRRLRVVVDGANSVGSLVTPILLRELGCEVVSINCQLDGSFPGRMPEPIPANLETLSQAVRSLGADLGVAHDGDADRATFVDEHGNVLWGDQSFAIIAARVLSRAPNSVLVTPVSSGRLIEDVARQAGARIEWTEVGSVVVSHRVVEIGASLGGEENGGVFYPPHQAVRDGAMTAAQMVEIMAIEKKALSQLVSELPVYFSAKTKVRVPPEKKMGILQNLLKMTEGEERVTLDGVKVFRDDGWVLMRPSGTEPLWRCFAEAKTREEADRLCQLGVELIQKAVEGQQK